MDSEIKDALLKLIETGTEIAPHVMYDLLLWAKIEPLMFIPVLILFSASFLYCIQKTEKTSQFNAYDFISLMSIAGFVFFSIGFTVSIPAAIQAHFTPYAYLINLIK